MSNRFQSLPFTQPLIDAAPDTLGVFALWQNGGVIYLGKASAGAATIRKALAEQFQARRWSSSAPLRCRWKWPTTRTSATASSCASSRKRTAARRSGTIRSAYRLKNGGSRGEPPDSLVVGAFPQAPHYYRRLDHRTSSAATHLG